MGSEDMSQNKKRHGLSMFKSDALTHIHTFSLYKIDYLQLSIKKHVRLHASLTLTLIRLSLGFDRPAKKSYSISIIF